MNNQCWRDLFTICNRVLGEGTSSEISSSSWCAWTTFDMLQERVFYWNSGIPSKSQIQETHISEGVWSQPFLYAHLAHLIIPKVFYWESVSKSGFDNGDKTQNIEFLSQELSTYDINHLLSEYWLEIKLF